MRSYPLRATSVCGKYLYSFSLEDAPIPLDNETFVLSNVPNSPILLYNSILKGCDVEDFFAGDIVRVNGKDYLLSYHRGLVGKSLDEEADLLYLDDIGNFDMVSNIYNRKVDMLSRQLSFPYKWKDTTFYLEKIYGMKDGMLLVNVKGGLMIPPNEIQQYAGIRGVQGEKVFFGDYGTRLVNGQIIATVNGGDINITKGGKLV